jgi:two-component system OmpR family sensor kinase
VDSSQLSDAGALEGDSDLLAVAVANLIDNAARHGAHHVRLKATRTRTSQRIEIEDDGPGVSADRLTQLKQPWSLEHRGEIVPHSGSVHPPQ